MITMKVLKPMPFRGVAVSVGDKIEADDEAQAALLVTIGLAERVTVKRRGYTRRDMQVEVAHEQDAP